MKAFEKVETEHGNSQMKNDQQIEELNNRHLSELRQLEQDYSAQVSRLSSQVESLQSSKNKTETSLKG